MNAFVVGMLLVVGALLLGWLAGAVVWRILGPRWYPDCTCRQCTWGRRRKTP